MFERLAALAFLSAALLCAQDPRTIKGVVADTEGKPVSGAHIDFEGGPAFWGKETDTEGRFEIATAGPVAVVRRAGYRSERIQTDASRNVRITLRPADRKIATCASGRRCDFGMFCFPEISGVRAGRADSDIDYTSRYYTVTRTNAGLAGWLERMAWFRTRKGISHGAGPNWTRGVPNRRDVSESLAYEEAGLLVEGDRVGVANPIGIVDAKGTNADGKRWRYLGVIAESASYHDMDDAAARLLDRVLDGVCIRGGR